MPLRIRNRIASLFPLGIAARLAVSFIAVAVLAATANFIARETVAVVYLPPHESPPPAPVATPKRATHETLLSALAALDEANQQRLETNSKLAESNFEKAADELKRAAGGTPRLESGATDYVQRARQLIRLSDSRRDAHALRAKLTATLYERLRNALDGSLKIFGRVLARQSLVELRNDFDRVRTLSDIRADTSMPTPTERERLAAAENEYLAVFTANQAGLERSEGADWVEGMRTDFTALIAVQTTLERSIVEAADAAKQLSRSRAGLSAAVLNVDLAAVTSTAISAPMALPPDAVAQREEDEQAAARTAATAANRHARTLMALVTSLVICW